MRLVDKSASTVLICGAGFGGVATAVALRRQLSPSEVDIVLVDRRTDFVMGLRKSWAALGIDTLDAGRRDLASIHAVRVVTGEVTALHPASKTVEVNGGTLAADLLVVAMGAAHATDSVPGLAEHGINVWDRDQAARARAALSGMTTGRLLVGIFGTPYSCPPGPFELAMLARDARGPGLEIAVFSPAPMALPVAGAGESAKLERFLAERNIDFKPSHQAVAVDEHSVRFRDGSELAYDVLLAVPPHSSPQVLTTAGLTDPGGWVKPDPRTLETTYDGVYAIGDCTAITLSNGLPLPKAGVFAQAQGEVVAARIAGRLRGTLPVVTFSGEGVCFIETGGGTAASVEGAFMADPPQVELTEPSSQNMANKMEFEQSRLDDWFGAAVGSERP
jgi:sulfide:quinone oxidoreductase